MSEEALQEYEEALKEQHTRNEARRIRTRVAEARGNPRTAGIRWPFELLQNALDAGPRNQRSSVTISLRYDASKVVFEHDGAPFTSKDLAALLSGGSNKEFESEHTTGRFGTGFLVTHVLSERTKMQGLLDLPNGYEQFDLELDRGGSEDDILGNIHSCNEAILNAKSVIDVNQVPSATFEYDIKEIETRILGAEALKRSLPYLYVTRQTLGNFYFELETEKEKWTPNDLERKQVTGGYMESRSLHVEINGDTSREFCAYRFMTHENASASALVLVEQTVNGWKVRLPEPDAPRIYREYPLRGSGFLPINFLLDGSFDPDQERSRLLMNEKDKGSLKEAFDATILAVEYAFQQKWEDAHLLASACKPMTAFDPSDAGEMEWWTEQLAIFGGKLTMLAIVDCDHEFLPAISDQGCYADFVIPSLLPSSSKNETTVKRMFPLVKAATELFPPRKDIAGDWTTIAQGWQDLGVSVNCITLSDLAVYVRDGAITVDQLAVDGDPKVWLTEFLDVVGECWNTRAGVDFSVLNELLPNQNQRLCSPSGLNLDAGISEELKDISLTIGNDVRNRLVDHGIDEIAKAAGFLHASEALRTAISSSILEQDVVEEVVKKLNSAAPEDKDFGEETSGLQNASVRFLHYLWKSQPNSAALSARRVPLISSRGRSIRWSQDRMMMAPVCSWGESARPFANAYPPHRVLADLYVGNESEGIANTVPALLEWESLSLTRFRPTCQPNLGIDVLLHSAPKIIQVE